MGRSKYKKIYCQELVNHMKSGYSIESFCAVIDVTRTTLQNWAQKHPDFRDAYELAMGYSSAYWEDKLIRLAENGHYGAIRFALERLHSRQWGNNPLVENKQEVYEIETGVNEDEEDSE